MRGRTTILLAALLASSACAPASAAASDASATQAYLQADYRLVQRAATHLGVASSALDGLLARVQRECPRAAGAGPQDEQSTELSNEVVGAMITAAIHSDLGSIREFVRAVAPLRWSSHRLTAQVHGYVSQMRTMAALAQPDVCADIRAWAASGFHALPATTLSFSPRFMACWVALGMIPNGLSRFESGAGRALARRDEGLENRISEFEVHRVQEYGRIMNALELSP
jgi:hypothetical protein